GDARACGLGSRIRRGAHLRRLERRPPVRAGCGDRPEAMGVRRGRCHHRVPGDRPGTFGRGRAGWSVVLLRVKEATETLLSEATGATEAFNVGFLIFASVPSE